MLLIPGGRLNDSVVHRLLAPWEAARVLDQLASAGCSSACIGLHATNVELHPMVLRVARWRELNYVDTVEYDEPS